MQYIIGTHLSGHLFRVEKVTGSVMHSRSLTFTSLAFSASMETHTGSFSCPSYPHWDTYAVKYFNRCVYTKWSCGCINLPNKQCVHCKSS